MPVITLQFAPEDRVQRTTPSGTTYGTVLSTSWESTSGQGRYYIQWDGTAFARPYSDNDLKTEQIVPDGDHQTG
ncbi:hypothetical protein GCM10020000_87030 [Streptomyces olivoverticillatus]